jgi:hypothetical protein
MQVDYLTLSDGRRVRIMWNMNALGDFTRATGKEISDLSGGRADVGTLRTIAWCAAKEGEAAEGKFLELTEEQFGRLMSMSCIVQFSEILATQSGGAGQKKSPDRGRQPLIFFRKKD